MYRFIVPVLLLAGVLPASTHALELTNIRATHGALGQVRSDNKYLPGDYLFISFDINNLQVEAKTGKVKYQTSMEILDSEKKQAFQSKAPAKEVLLVGGGTVPTFAYASLGVDQKPGKYAIKVSVTDELAKTSKDFSYDFEIVAEDFGFVQIFTPAVTFSGQDFTINFALAGMDRNKDQLPEVEITMQMLDSAGRKLWPKAVTFNTKVLHAPPATDLTRLEVVPISIPIFLNQPGVFAVSIEAEDQLSKKKKVLRLPVRVLDANQYTGK